jgi:hypothetical protein
MHNKAGLRHKGEIGVSCAKTVPIDAQENQPIGKGKGLVVLHAKPAKLCTPTPASTSGSWALLNDAQTPVELLV